MPHDVRRRDQRRVGRIGIAGHQERQLSIRLPRERRVLRTDDIERTARRAEGWCLCFRMDAERRVLCRDERTMR
jgi:hypothetical protein